MLDDKSRVISQTHSSWLAWLECRRPFPQGRTCTSRLLQHQPKPTSQLPEGTDVAQLKARHACLDSYNVGPNQPKGTDVAQLTEHCVLTAHGPERPAELTFLLE